MIRLLHGPAQEQLRVLPENSVDAVCCDPPYELGFMNKGWDRSGIANSVALWAEVHRVLKPGGHLVAFGGTRTYHRMACAIEDAGFEIRDSLEWLYGSGFPKSLDVSKAIDKAAGAEREVVGTQVRYNEPSGIVNAGRGPEARTLIERKITTAATDTAKQWAGWGTALKPAHEPIVLARKALVGTVAKNVQQHGTGGINIDGCRLGEIPPSVPQREFRDVRGEGVYGFGPGEGRNGEMSHSEGRWPPNVLLNHIPSASECTGCGLVYIASAPEICLGCGRSSFNVHPGCVEEGTKRVTTSQGVRGASRQLFEGLSAEVGQVVGYADAEGKETVASWKCVDGCPVPALDAQSGVRPAGAFPGRQNQAPGSGRTMGDGWTGEVGPARRMGDTGGASRFFPQFQVEGDPPFYYVAKASRREREAGCDQLPERLTNQDCPPDSLGAQSPRAGAGRGAGAPRYRCVKCDLALGGGRNVGACRLGGEHERELVGHGPGIRNNHPTVKPVALMRWLVRLVCPPGGVVLDPFMGSGTTGIACAKEGFHFVGCELDGDYIEIARARITHAGGSGALEIDLPGVAA